MADEFATPDPVDLTRQVFEAASRHDVDAMLSFYAPDGVMDLSDAALGIFEGVTAIGSFLEGWYATWAEHVIKVEEALDLGRGVVFSAVWEHARVQGSGGHVQQRRAWVFLWVENLISHAAGFLDIGEGRAAAERLAQELG